MSCELCKAVINSNSHLLAWRFWVVLECRTHHVPMVVLKRHAPRMTKAEGIDLIELWKTHYPHERLRTQMGSILDHLHYHFE